MNDQGQSQDVTPSAQEVVTQHEAETPPWLEGKTEPTAPQNSESQPQQPEHQEQQRQVKSPYQRRIDELVREREMERAEKKQLLDLVAKYQTGQQAPAQQQQGQTAAQTQAPQVESFDSYEKYLAAYARWEAKSMYEELRKQDEESRQKETAETRQRTAVEEQQKQLVQQQATLSKMTAEAQKKYPDFYETVFEQDPSVAPISPVVGQAILSSKDGFEVAYYLGKNPAEAQRIAQLSPVEQLVEVGMIKAAIKAKATVSSAPAPITPVSGRVAGNELPSAQDDMATWIAKRNRQMGRK